MLQGHTHGEISKAIVRSQHTQRNFDLSKTIPEEDIKLMMTAVTECPSKQNVAYYRVHFIEDRDLIQDIHEHTRGFNTKQHESGYETNTQVLGNLLVLFERHLPNDRLHNDNVRRNEQARYFEENGKWEDEELLTKSREDDFPAFLERTGTISTIFLNKDTDNREYSPNAVAVINANKNFISKEATAWQNSQIASAESGSTWDGYTFNTVLFESTIQNEIDGVVHDIKYGGNEKTRNNASSFWIQTTEVERIKSWSW